MLLSDAFYVRSLGTVSFQGSVDFGYALRDHVTYQFCFRSVPWRQSQDLAV